MQHVGHICELWRYPISSVGGEQVEQLETSQTGIPGDRQFALFDCASGHAAAPEKDPRWRPALLLKSRLTAEDVPRLGFPDGQWLAVDDAALPGLLSGYFGFAVGIGATGQAVSPLTGALPGVANRYEPSAIHVITTASLNTLAGLVQVESVASRRFRPTIVLDSGIAAGFLENEWIGGTLQIGEAQIRIVEATKRCGMTLIAQPGLDEEPEILRQILRHNKRNLGVYGVIDRPGVIAVGDPVYAEI